MARAPSVKAVMIGYWQKRWQMLQCVLVFVLESMSQCVCVMLSCTQPMPNIAVDFLNTMGDHKHFIKWSFTLSSIKWCECTR